MSDSLSTPQEALDQWGHSLRKSVEHDNLNNKIVVYDKVQVLTHPTPLSVKAATAIEGDPANPAESDSVVGRYQFLGRIRDENSPHDLYPDPCNLTWAPDVEQAKRILNCYTLYLSPPGFTPQKFSYVRVQHRVGPDGRANLQYGRCIEASPKSILSDNEYNVKAKCVDLSSLFDAAQEVEIFSIPGARSTAEDIKKAYPQVASSEGLAEKIVAVAEKIGIPDPGWLANLINFESKQTFSPKIANADDPGTPIGCRGPECTPPCKGLIQFCPGKKEKNSGVVGIMIAHSSGLMTGLNVQRRKDRITAVERLTELTAVEQMDYVEEYLSPYSGKLKISIDLYMAVFQPTYIGHPDKQFTTVQIKANKGIITPRHYASKVNHGAKLPTELA